MKQITHIPKFRRFVIQNFPFIEEDFDALTDYGLISKVVEYLNTVINSQNDLSDNFTELNNAFIELHDYVEHYFDNLDVQTEINNKLDSMAEDGSLYEIIRQYTDPIIATIEEQVDYQNGKIASVETDYKSADNLLQTQIDGLASGSPLVASSTSEMTNTSKIYVNTTNGKWYYYDGDSWEIGGTYQSAEDSTATTKNTNDINYILSSSNIYSYGFEYGAYQLDGNPVYNTIRIRTKKINTNRFKSFILHFPSTLAIAGRHSFDGSTYNTNSDTDIQMTNVSSGVLLTVANNVEYIDVVLKNATSADTNITQGEMDASYIEIAPDSDTVDKSTPKVINCEYGGITLDGSLVDNTIRIRSLLIPTVGIHAFKLHFPSTLKYIFTVGCNNETWERADNYSIQGGNSLTLLKDYEYIRVAFAKQDSVSNITEEELAHTTVEVVDSTVAGKKYVALGDSITYGFIPRNAPNYPGQLKSYAVLTAEKLGMSFVNAGISGNTLAQIGEVQNPMCVRYTDLPDDADVITIMGGTNDIRRGVPLGDFNSRSPQTWYGALHQLLGGLYKKYFIDQGTNTKTKIIMLTPIKLVKNRATTEGGTATLYDFTDYIKAIKEVADYYSIPVFDWNKECLINPHLNSTYEGVSDQSPGWFNPYVPDGTHPNEAGAEIMAQALSKYMSNLQF